MFFNSNSKYLSIAGKFTNSNQNTTYACTVSTGTIEYNGSGAKTYDQGSSQLDLCAVVINNSTASRSGVTLSTNMFIKSSTGKLTPSNGTITAGALRVKVNNTSGSAGSNTSFVDGNIRRHLSSCAAYSWPVRNITAGFQRALNSCSTSSIGYIVGIFDSWPATAGYPPVQNMV